MEVITSSYSLVPATLKERWLYRVYMREGNLWVHLLIQSTTLIIFIEYILVPGIMINILHALSHNFISQKPYEVGIISLIL